MSHSVRQIHPLRNSSTSTDVLIDGFELSRFTWAHVCVARNLARSPASFILYNPTCDELRALEAHQRIPGQRTPIRGAWHSGRIPPFLMQRADQQTRHMHQDYALICHYAQFCQKSLRHIRRHPPVPVAHFADQQARVVKISSRVQRNQTPDPILCWVVGQTLLRCYSMCLEACGSELKTCPSIYI